MGSTPVLPAMQNILVLCRTGQTAGQLSLGALAHLGERFVRNEEVTGSSPVCSTSQPQGGNVQFAFGRQIHNVSNLITWEVALCHAGSTPSR